MVVENMVVAQFVGAVDFRRIPVRGAAARPAAEITWRGVVHS